MNATAFTREKDQLVLPEGFFQEPYTPAAGRIVSPSLGKKLAFAKFALSADADVTWKDVGGNTITAFSLSKGVQPFLVTEIITVTAGSVMIIHDGIIWSQDSSAPDMTRTFSIT